MSSVQSDVAVSDTERRSRREVAQDRSTAELQRVLAAWVQAVEIPSTDTRGMLPGLDVRAVLARFWWLLLLGVLAGVASAALALQWFAPLYRVDAQVLIGRQDVAAEDAGTGSLLGAGSSAFIATQAQLMQSRWLLERAVERVPVPVRPAQPLQAAVDTVRSSPVSGTQTVSLAYLGPDPAWGSALLQAIVAAYDTYLRDTEARARAGRVAAKEEEIALLRAQAQRLDEELRGAREAAGVPGSAADALAALRRQAETELERLAEVRERRITLESRLQAGGGEWLGAIEGADRGLAQQLQQAQAELARRRRTLTAAHPAVQAAEREVAALEEQLSRVQGTQPDQLRREVASVRLLEARLEAAHGESLARLAALERLHDREDSLLRQRDELQARVERGLNELLDQQVAVRLAQTGELGVSVRLIAAPMVPAAPVWPRPALLLPLGALAGVALAALLAFALHARGQAGRDRDGDAPRYPGARR